MDDCLFFCKAEVKQCQTILDITGSYGKASGHDINFNKSLMFGKRISNQTKDQLKCLIGINKEGGIGNYLGIP